jgi:surface antigen
MKEIFKPLFIALLAFNICNVAKAQDHISTTPPTASDEVVAVSDEDASLIRGSAWSPNNLPKGECTWYVDGRAKETGWNLKFSANYGRYANYWWTMVTNAKQGQLGYSGDIMVLNSWKGNSYGHVAFVESSTPGSSWNVTHANWKTGKPTNTIEKQSIYKATFVKSGSSVQLSGTGSKYPLLGFLYKK